MSESNYISIKGAKVNNLKNIDVNIPRNKLVVITGLSCNICILSLFPADRFLLPIKLRMLIIFLK